MARVGLQVVRN